jgi:hypothetical protein
MIKAIKAAAEDKDEKKRILTENELRDKVK